MVGVMATSSKRTYASMPRFPGLLYSVSLTLQEVTVNHVPTRDSQMLTDKSKLVEGMEFQLSYFKL